MGRYLIVGGGISGCTAAFELARLGHEVTVIERESRFGGKVLDYCCKATDRCSRCGVCVAVSQLASAAAQERVRISTGSTIRQVRWNGAVEAQVARRNPYIDPGRCIACDACIEACPAGCIERQQKGELIQYVVDYAACRLHQGKQCEACLKACPAGAVSAGSAESLMELRADALLVATGHQPYDAARKIRLGYGRLSGVLTGSEAEELLGRQESLAGPKDSVAFIQCVGSRDPKEGRNYCSAVCCAYALRLARILKYRQPQADICIYYIDLQNFDKAFSALREELTASGIRFVRGIPFRVEQSSTGRLQLWIENANGDQSVVEHDRVVLSVGLGPDPEAEELAKLLGLDRNEFGFFADQEPAGLFVTGTCAEPQSIPDSMSSAKAAAAAMSALRPPAAAPARRPAASKGKGRAGARGEAAPKTQAAGARGKAKKGGVQPRRRS